MDRYCPECNSTMTPSLVGYLCPECGNMQRFYTANPLTAQLDTKELPAAPSPARIDSPQQPISREGAEENKKIRSTLKRLMVPELSPPHHEQIISAEKQKLQPEPTEGNIESKPQESSLIASRPTLYQADQDALASQESVKPSGRSMVWLWVILALALVTLMAVIAINVMGINFGLI